MKLIKKIIIKLLSRKTISVIRNSLHLFELKSTREVFNKASEIPVNIGIDILDELQNKYSFPPDYGYDKDSLANRGTLRAKEILRFSGAKKSHSFLELGCWDGMVSCFLSKKGKRVTAIDKTIKGFDNRAEYQGVKFFQMDAANLQFENDSFDFIFSYDSFEHFEQPELVLREAIRVLRNGGYIFLSFGPLYYSPFGEHAYRSITIPYCQFLFPKELINIYANQNGLTPIDFNHVNGWSLDDYSNLWNKYCGVLYKLRYTEIQNLEHVNLIRKYPSHFKKRSNNFNNFIVSSVDILLRKK